MSVDVSSYRAAIGRFLTGVTLVTTRSAGLAQGLTASAVASVSLEPPTLLVCVNRNSTTCEAIAAAQHFCINVLATQQADAARIFASRGSDKFAESSALGYRWVDNSFGAPRLDGALAALDCRVSHYSDVHTHRVFFGEVVTVVTATDAPLGYFCGGFVQLTDPAT
jgi:flavin reductase (DIM6/NTAB) family NADH-FMN oxidoreductase RutF